MRQRAREFFDELRSRSVIRSLIAYAVVSWMLLQVADVTFDRLPIPDISMTVLIILVIAGFPVTAALAWAYEVTHRGIVRHSHTDGGAPRLRFMTYFGIVAFASLATGFFLYDISRDYFEPPPRSIAVLPFTNQSATADTDWFSDGLTEEIRSVIVRLGEFRVVAMSTSYQLRNAITDVVSVAQRLGAEVVLHGSVRRLENRVSVTARLVDGGDGSELWSEDYERELSDIYAIKEDIARQVARALHIVLPVPAERRLANIGTRNIEAYDAYLRGIDYLRQPPDESTLIIAEGFLRESMALDPVFPHAHAAMCEKHLASYRLSRDPERFGNAERACQSALEHDDGSALVRLALGGLYQASGKYENALHEYEEALASNDNLPDVYIGLAQTLFELGRIDEAEINLRLAIDTDVSYWASFNAMGNFLFRQGRFMDAAEFYQMFISRSDDDAQALNNLGAAYYLAGDFRRAAEAWDTSLATRPTRSAYSNTGSMYFYLGEFDEAADRYARAVNLAPNDYQLWGNLADAYYYTSDKRHVADVAYQRAIEFGDKMLAINPGDADVTSDVAYYRARVNEKKTALAMDATARAAAPDNMYVFYNSALIHAHFGDIDAALSALERAVELDYQPELLPLDPAFRAIGDEPRFRQLLADAR